MSWADERAGEDALREREYERRERAKSATVPRAVADRLEHRVAEAVRLANGRWDEWGSRAVDVADAINNALNEYRKAVAGG